MADQHTLRGFANDTLMDISHASGYPGVKTVAQVTLHSSVVDPIRRYDFEYKVARERKSDLQNKLQFVSQTNRSPRQNLTSFLRWGRRHYPAKRFCVVLQGHAWGADYTIPSLNLSGGGDFHAHSHCRLIFGTPRSKNHLSNRQLQDALTEASGRRKFDLLGMDSCLMSMAEILYELNRCARYTVAPEGFGPIRGWPFYSILMKLNQKPSIGPTELGTSILDKYTRHYAEWGGRMNLSISLCALSHSLALMQGVKRLVSALTLGLKDSAVASAIVRSRSECPVYRIPTYIDLNNFCRLLMHQRRIRSQDSLYKACSDVRSILTDGFVQRVALKRSSVDSFGLSIYFPNWQIGRKKPVSRFKAIPWSNAFGTPRNIEEAILKIDAAYADHEFADRSGWREFLICFLKHRLVLH